MIAAEVITIDRLLQEMTDRDGVARWPEPQFQALQASSYNRASTHRNQPAQDASGWFADSDGLGFLRTESHDGKTEWVLMEHDGPGCLTKFWTPYFYFDLNNRIGPNLRIYLDHAPNPVVDESFIQWVTGKGSLPAPWAAYTARAGDAYLPIPFARHCKVTTTAKPFYYLINYRAYPPGVKVSTFRREDLAMNQSALEAAARSLEPDRSPPPPPATATVTEVIAPGKALQTRLPAGPRAVASLLFRMPDATQHPAVLRSTILRIQFDGEETVWCPIGDFFSSPDGLHPFATWQRTVHPDGTMVCQWVMPYTRSAHLSILNLAPHAVQLYVQIQTKPWKWDTRSMHFHARWRPDDIVPGTPFQDWNYVDVHGRGVYVGDSWTVVNPQGSWWGEGDEKIYVDDAWDRGFPTHFGTGSEDYYGWAGGEIPTRRDEFSTPFLANVRVGGLDGFTTGYNICTRTRSLDAIPFRQRLRFDMESSFGTDIRNPWNLLGYSVVTFWYGFPGGSDNRPAAPEAARIPILSVETLRQKSAAIQHRELRPGPGVSPGR